MTPYQPQGTVYGTLLNFSREHALWAPRMHEAPYKAPPQAPVLYVKTANTFNPSGGSVPLPARVPEVEVGASIGLVIGDLGSFNPDVSAHRSFIAIKNEVVGAWPVAGCVLLNDLSVPHESYYRPPVKFKNLDGFLGVGTQCLPLGPAELAALVLEVRINGNLCQTVALTELLRPAAQLLADVNEFMTLRPGNVLMLGTDCLDHGQRPRARVGDRIEISAPGFAPLVHTVVEEALP